MCVIIKLSISKAFTGVIIALSCTGGILVLCLIFTIILLLNKKKKIEGWLNERL